MTQISRFPSLASIMSLGLLLMGISSFAGSMIAEDQLVVPSSTIATACKLVGADYDYKLISQGLEWIDCDWLRLNRGTSDFESPLFEVRILCDRKDLSPEGYEVSRIWTGITGLKVGMFRPLDASQPWLLTFAGSQDLQDAKAAVKYGQPQFQQIARLRFAMDPNFKISPTSSLRYRDFALVDANRKFFDELTEFTKTNPTVISGHSLGGALAQSTAVEIFKRNPKAQIRVVTFNGLSGRAIVKAVHPDSDVLISNFERKVPIQNFRSKSDLVSALHQQIGTSQIIDADKKRSFSKDSWFGFKPSRRIDEHKISYVLDCIQTPPESEKVETLKTSGKKKVH